MNKDKPFKIGDWVEWGLADNPQCGKIISINRDGKHAYILRGINHTGVEKRYSTINITDLKPMRGKP